MAILLPIGVLAVVLNTVTGLGRQWRADVRLPLFAMDVFVWGVLVWLGAIEPYLQLQQTLNSIGG